MTDSTCATYFIAQRGQIIGWNAINDGSTQGRRTGGVKGTEYPGPEAGGGP